jgi:hypothetical protein
VGPDDRTIWSSGGGEYRHPDMATAQFIAHAREDVAALVERVEALEAERTAIAVQLQRLAPTWSHETRSWTMRQADDGPYTLWSAAAETIRATMWERDEAKKEAAESSKEMIMLFNDHSSIELEQQLRIEELTRERDKARAEGERLRGVLHIVSLDEYESTSSASEKVHAHARQARAALNQTTSMQPSDAAHIASLENLFLKACQRAKRHEDAAKNAYRRGAEATLDACVATIHDGGLVWTRESAERALREIGIPEEP